MPESAPEWFRKALVAPRESRRVDVDGCDIHYLRWGGLNRPGIVLVHGGAAHAHWWTHFGPLLAGVFKDAASGGTSPVGWMTPFLIAGISCLVGALIMMSTRSPQEKPRTGRGRGRGRGGVAYGNA